MKLLLFFAILNLSPVLNLFGQNFSTSDDFVMVSLQMGETDSLKFEMLNVGNDTLTILTPDFFHLTADWKASEANHDCKIFASLGENGDHLSMLDRADFVKIPSKMKLVVLIGIDSIQQSFSRNPGNMLVQIHLRYSLMQFRSGWDGYDAFYKQSKSLTLFAQSGKERGDFAKGNNHVFKAGFFKRLNTRWYVE